jgi:Uma2 family endonuclease
MAAITLNLKSITQLTDEQFFQLCQDNQEIELERNAKGELIVVPPVGGETGNRNAGLTAQLWIWNDRDQLGQVFDSSTGFQLPNGANRSPDASWVRLERWNALTSEQQTRFLPLCPDFAVELMSPSDSLNQTQEKMREYRDNGTRLGWLINRRSRQIEIYRLDREVEVLQSPATVSGEDVLPGFVLNLASIW